MQTKLFLRRRSINATVIRAYEETFQMFTVPSGRQYRVVHGLNRIRRAVKVISEQDTQSRLVVAVAVGVHVVRRIPVERAPSVVRRRRNAVFVH